MATKYFPWQIFSEKVSIIQFTWRMLVFSNFFFAIICAINMENLIKNLKMLDIIFIVTIAISITLYRPVPISSNDIPEINEYNIGSIEKDKNEVIIAMGRGEYLPAKSNQNREYILNRENTIEILEGKGNIESLEKNGQKLTAEIEIFEDNTILELPYIYYPGYKITINKEDIKSLESENGFLAISLNKMEQQTLAVDYEETTLMKLSKWTTVLGIIIFILYINIEKIKKLYIKSKIN